MAFPSIRLAGVALLMSALVFKEVAAREIGVGCGKECPLGGSSQKYPNGIATLYHGTNREAAVKIMKDGFEPGKSGGLAGNAIYFGRTKSQAFFSSRHGCKVIIEATVNLGCILEVKSTGDGVANEWDKRTDVEKNAPILASMNCDSIMLIFPTLTSNTGHKEIALYSNDNITHKEICTSGCACM